MKFLLAAGAVGAMALAAAGSANATTDVLMSVTYTDGTFDDGGTFSGSFVFDETTGNFVAWNVVTTAGSTLGGTTYTNFDPDGEAAPIEAGFFGQVTDSYGDGTALELDSSDLSGSTGSLEGVEFVQADCASSCVEEEARTVTGGIYNLTVSGGVPEPATWALMTLGAGLAGVALRRRRRSALA